MIITSWPTHLMWFGPGVQVVAHVPVAGPKKNKTFLLVMFVFAHCFF